MPLLSCTFGGCQRCEMGGCLETAFVWQSQQCGVHCKQCERCYRLIGQYNLVLMLESHVAMAREARTQSWDMSLFLVHATTDCSLLFSLSFVTDLFVLHTDFTKCVYCWLGPSFATSSSLLDFQPSPHIAC